MRRHYFRMFALAAAAALLAGPALADKIAHPTATFAGLDKITGRIITFDVAIDETVQFGSLQITPRVCYTRPQTEAPRTDGFVEVDEILDTKKFRRIFSGWMFAASPGLNGVEHPVYDVWLTGCKGDGRLIESPPEAKDEPPPPPPSNADVPPLGTEPAPKTTRRTVEPLAPPVTPPDISEPPPAPAPPPQRAPSRRYYPDVKVGPDPAGN